jgi:hypothetical protein
VMHVIHTLAKHLGSAQDVLLTGTAIIFVSDEKPIFPGLLI